MADTSQNEGHQERTLLPTEPEASSAPNDHASATAQPQEEASVVEASATPPPPPRPKNKAEMHVGFSPDPPRMMDLVFQEALTAQEELANAEFHERLYADALVHRQRRNEKHDEASRTFEERELEGATFKPEISKAAQNQPKYENFAQFVSHNEERVKRAAFVFKQKKIRLLAERDEDMTHKPKLSKATERIVKQAQRSGTYKGPVKGWNQRFSHHLMKKTREPPAQDDHKPHTGRPPRGYAASDPNETFDRLYDDAQTRAAAQRIVERAQRHAEEASFFRPLTNDRCVSLIESSVANGSGLHLGRGLPGGEPQDIDVEDEDWDGTREILAFVEQPSRTIEQVVDSLALKGEEYRQRAQSRRHQYESERMKDCTFAPTTNKKSKEMVRKWLELTVGGDHATHLDLPIHGDANPDTPSPLRTHFLRNEQEAIRFVKGRSAVKAEPRGPPKKFDADLFCSRVERGQAERARRLEELRLQKIADDCAECTFRPAITKVSDEIAKSRGDVYPDQALHSRSVIDQTPRVLFAEKKDAASLSPLSSVRGRGVAAPATARASFPRPEAVPRHRLPARASTAYEVPEEEHLNLRFAPDDNDAKGMHYLQELEEELKGVIAEWQHIE